MGSNIKWLSEAALYFHFLAQGVKSVSRSQLLPLEEGIYLLPPCAAKLSACSSSKVVEKNGVRPEGADLQFSPQGSKFSLIVGSTVAWS